MKKTKRWEYVTIDDDDGSTTIRRPCCGATGTIVRPDHQVLIPHLPPCPLLAPS
jgi:hypothetical protein